jgi:hypothetical protein
MGEHIGAGLNTDDKKALFLLALKELNGNISEACKVARISSRQTYYNWLESDDEFKIAARSIQLDVTESILDEAEEVVRFWLKRMDKQAAQWLLKQLGKKRGYGNRMEVEVSPDAFRGLEFPDEPSDVEAWEQGDLEAGDE